MFDVQFCAHTGNAMSSISSLQRAKDEGNRVFKGGNYWAAFQAYSVAIQHGPGNPVYYSNRAMAALKVSCACDQALLASHIVA